MNMMEDISVGKTLRYMFMPQVVPRFQNLVLSGFSNLAYLVALVYRAVNIIPAAHPLFLRQNRDRLKLGVVMNVAWTHIKFTRKNIDQIIVFAAINLGMFLLALQFLTILGYVMLNPALAAAAIPTTYAGFFQDPHETDLVYIMLWAVFGVPELFRPGGTQTEFHTALHSLFQLYSIGMLVIAAIIICYYIFAVLAETAQTGVPFGKRFNHVWAPIRLVVALGLLVPVGYGLNSAQWITLHMAKFGSDFATRGWIIFNDTMNEAYLNDPETRVGTPKVPNISPLAAFMTTALACKTAYEFVNTETVNGSRIQAYIISGPDAENSGAPLTLGSTAPTATPTPGAAPEIPSDYFIRFGIYDPDLYKKERANVSMHCGDLVIYRGEAVEEGAASIQESYLTLVNDIWNGSYGIRANASSLVIKQLMDSRTQGPLNYNPNYKAIAVDEINEWLGGDGTAQNAGQIGIAVEAQANSSTWTSNQQMLRDFGWGGAAIWYNKIAQINGSLMTAVNNTPQGKAMPGVLEYMKLEQLQQNTSAIDLFKSSLSDGREMQFSTPSEKIVGDALSVVVEDWTRDPNQGALSNQTRTTGNFFIDIINVIFGTQGLFAMCQNTDVHPLAQLSMLGKGLVESSIRNVALGLIFSGGQFVPIGAIGAIASAASGMLMSVASMTLTMGFVLFHVLPLMPFLYFFSAVGGWVKGLFEAMVGLPLWALAFLHIDGEGLPGDAASKGFYFILEIFLRPIMIIFGLLASIVIFAAMVKVLNEIFFIVVNNVAGHDPRATTMCGSLTTGGAGGGTGGGTGGGGDDPMTFFRGPIDELFFTVIYAIIVYMIGMSCFKLIDLIPNNILRYMGESLSTFGDKAGDPAQGLLGRISLAGSVVGGQIIGPGGIINSAVSGAANSTKGAVELANRAP